MILLKINLIYKKKDSNIGVKRKGCRNESGRVRRLIAPFDHATCDRVGAPDDVRVGHINIICSCLIGSLDL